MTSISNLLNRLLQFFGLQDADTPNYTKLEVQLRASRSANQDQLQLLKEQVQELENQIRNKKRELDVAKGETKRMISGEIERLFLDIDRLRGKETIVSRNLDKISLTLSKIGEAMTAQDQGVSEDMLDGLAIDLEDNFSELRATDRTARSLSDVRYQEEAKSNSVDISVRMEELEDAKPAPTTLNPDIQLRMGQLIEEH